jgi:hypothetical protein
MLDRRRWLQATATAVGSGVLASCTRAAAPTTTAIPPHTGGRACGLPSSGAGIRFNPSAPALFLSAHCDDAAVEAWHLLSTLKPAKLAIAFMAVPAARTPPPDDHADFPDAPAYIRARHAEEQAALAPLGIDPIYLSGLDMPYRGGKNPNLGALATELAERVPEASQIICPLGVGLRFRVGTQQYSHVDHKFARDIADSFRAIPKVYYGEVYAISEKTSDYAQLEAEVRAFAHWRVEKRVLDAAAFAAKKRAFEAYATQVKSMLAALPDLMTPAIFGTEIYCYPG